LKAAIAANWVKIDQNGRILNAETGEMYPLLGGKGGVKILVEANRGSRAAAANAHMGLLTLDRGPSQATFHACG
jgi:hypothetical protein